MPAIQVAQQKGRNDFSSLEKIEDLPGRTVDNADFLLLSVPPKPADDVSSISS